MLKSTITYSEEERKKLNFCNPLIHSTFSHDNKAFNTHRKTRL